MKRFLLLIVAFVVITSFKKFTIIPQIDGVPATEITTEDYLTSFYLPDSLSNIWVQVKNDNDFVFRSKVLYKGREVLNQVDYPRDTIIMEIPFDTIRKNEKIMIKTMHGVMSIKEENSSYYVRFINSLGVYMDEDYPSRAVSVSVTAYLDSLICDGLSYLWDKKDLYHDLSGIESADDFFNVWQSYYDRNGDENPDSDISSRYQEIRGVRACVVSHKVASNEDWATYLMESSVDNHGSCGCNSSADYITYNINTGRPLSMDEVLKLYPVSNLKKKLREAYVNAAQERNFEPLEKMTGEHLLEEADGAAIINEGLLIYYRPYKIGCGAEEQYNLIVN